jgi:hypothetical protein
LGYGERECSKVEEAKDSSSKETRSSPTSTKKNDGTSLSESDRSSMTVEGNQHLLEKLGATRALQSQT